MCAVGKEHLVLDLSCRKWTGAGPEADRSDRCADMAAGASGEDQLPEYRIVTDRWQTFTEERVTPELLGELSASCAEFLVQAADVEGKAAGMEEGLLAVLAGSTDIPVTYAGGIGSLEDIRKIRDAGCGKLDFTVGSELDLFGGRLPLEEVLQICRA